LRQQNTNTGRLTAAMLDEVFWRGVSCSTVRLNQTVWLVMDGRKLVLLNSRGLG
jgi:hypothetical protein